MIKRILIFIFALLIIIPSNVFAISNDYNDAVAKYVNKNENTKKIDLYLFHGAECPHCEEERQWLKEIEKEYSNYLNINLYEVWHNDNNKKIMEDVKKELNITSTGVPLTVIGYKYFIGFSETMESKIENTIKEYIEIENDSNEIKIPILGKINVKNASIPLIASVLGFIDGFNPCAMWILLFLINMLFRLENKKKAWFFGFVFLFVSGLVYFMSMLGINLALGVVTIKYIKYALGLFILIAGILNIKKYFETRNKEAGCSVVDSKKRKKISNNLKKILNEKSFILALLGIIVLAASVNLIELACSLGFPLVFTEILSINNVNGIVRIIYLLIYIMFYMLDDIVVFSISMFTLEATGITNKYNKLCTLVSAILMITMGLLLLFKPEWLMLNF